MLPWLRTVDDFFPLRYLSWWLCGLGAVLSAVGTWYFWPAWPWFILFMGLSLLGFRDVRQTKRAVLRNYPVIGHLRFLLEYIRPEMRQYFIEADNEATPFSRQQLSLIHI